MIDEYFKQKQVYSEYVIFMKCGKFYYTYSNDGYIINYLFDYQIIKNKVAFPEIVLEKVKGGLEREKIAYLIVDKKSVYSSSKQKDYKEKYIKLLKKCKETYDYKRRIRLIYDKLLFCIKTKEIDEKLLSIEELL
jgi:hypothetical protein